MSKVPIIERLTAERDAYKAADEAMQRQYGVAHEKVEQLRALLREALCRGQLPDGLPERINAELAKEK